MQEVTSLGRLWEDEYINTVEPWNRRTRTHKHYIFNLLQKDTFHKIACFPGASLTFASWRKKEGGKIREGVRARGAGLIMSCDPLRFALVTSALALISRGRFQINLVTPCLLHAKVCYVTDRCCHNHNHKRLHYGIRNDVRLTQFPVF